MKKFFASIVLAASVAFPVLAANTVTTVQQVSGSVTVSSDVDYVIAGATPFTADGRVDITNTEHAVVIIKAVRPSKVISSWLRNHVFINGVQAVDGTNCQVKMYAYGAIIMPYAKDFKPLTVYSEQNFGGTAVNDFGLENSGGYMNTLTDAKLNNRIRSFKLKRGYMVTFSTRKGGRGYSRCFIADQEDLEIAELPSILDQSISSYRVFQWYNAKKAGLASDTRPEAIGALNASWCYDWGTGVNRLPDTECVPNHIYEDWPSSSACGGVTYACHMKTNNEPANSADDHPQSVAEVLANWENLMRTGLRLCSPATHDGGWGWHNEFMNAIDERGWRCDLVDFHGYWSNWDLDWRINTYAHGRPVWISEWVWGSSWNRDGFWANTNDPGSTSEANQTLCYNGTKPILDKLNAHSRIERYAYWNSEAAGTHIYHDGKLTVLGEYYANMNEGLGYNPKNEFIPKNPKQYDPSDLRAEYDKATRLVTLYWHEKNGEYNNEMVIECMASSSTGWKKVQNVELQEEEADYKVSVEGKIGYKYRIKVIDANGTMRYTNVTQTVSDTVEAGDEITIGEEVFYLGGNMLINGDFELGFTDWTNGKDEPLALPYYEIVPVGGVNGSAYLQAYGNSDDKMSEQSVRKVIELEENAHYYAQIGARNGADKNQKITTSTNQNFELNTRAAVSATTEWSKQGSGFEVTDDNLLLIQLRSLGAKAQFDDIIVAKLFATPEEAAADALLWAKKRAEAFKAYNTDCPQFNNEIDLLTASCTEPLLIEKGIKQALAAIKNLKTVPALCSEAELAISTKANDYAEIAVLLENLRHATTASEINEACAALSAKLQTSLTYIYNAGIKNGTFENAEGWNTKQGTYKGGDQRIATQAGKKCWNAWWSTPATEGAKTTMEINQGVSKLEHGFYALEAKATTQHYCVTDQHAFMVFNGDTLTTPNMSRGVLDIQGFDDSEKWETLHTPYIYINEKDELTVGFKGSKLNAIDNAHHTFGDATSKGDQREGWWCATDFVFRQIQAYKDSVDASGWGTICLPYAIDIPENTTLYEIAGITADKSIIAIRKVDVTEAGTPYIYYRPQTPVATLNSDADSKGSEIIFFERGDKAKSAKTNVNGLRGIFTNSLSQYPLNSLVLKDGVWISVTERYRIKDFSAYIYKVDNLPTLESWSGEYLPTEGLSAIGIVVMDGESSDGKVYSISGTRANKNTKGVLIKNGKKVLR